MTSHYFGAYLKIEVSQTLEHQSENRLCPNGHGLQDAYCRECGERSQQPPPVMKYPTSICDDLLGDEWEDVLSVITPADLFQTGDILAKSVYGQWLIVHDDEYDFEVTTKPFPTVVEVKALELELTIKCEDIIQALRRSEHVINVSVEVGYVLVQEY